MRYYKNTHLYNEYENVFSLQCNNCNHIETIPTAKYRIIGLGIVAFGVFGWFSFLFAGSGHALLISTVIIVVGIVTFLSAKSTGTNALLKQRCPKCDKRDWKKAQSRNRKTDITRRNNNDSNELKTCKKCGRAMVLRRGRYGNFWGCTGYSLNKCSHTEEYNGEK